MKVEFSDWRVMKPMLLVTIFFNLLVVNEGKGVARNWDWDQNHKAVLKDRSGHGLEKKLYDQRVNGRYEPKGACGIYCRIGSIDVNTGRYHKKFIDLIVPGLGPPLEIRRTYNSQTFSSGLFGNGWIFNYGRKLIVSRKKSGEKQICLLLDSGEKNYYREKPNGQLIRLTDYGAEFTLRKRTDGTYVINYQNGTVHSLGTAGKVESITDSNQNRLEFRYDATGCLKRITNASGNYIDLTLGNNGKISHINDKLGRTVTYGYDDRGNLRSMTDPLGNVTHYQYNAADNLVKIADTHGNPLETMVYDTHQPPRVCLWCGKRDRDAFTYFEGKTVRSDVNGNRWIYYYNDSGVIQTIIDPHGNRIRQQLNKQTVTSIDWEEDAAGNRIFYTFDIGGHVTSKSDPLGNIWRYEYVPDSGRLSSEATPLGGIRIYAYDDAGNCTALVLQRNQTDRVCWRFGYNHQGRLIKVTNPDGLTIRYTYDNSGRLTAATDTNNHTTRFEYFDGSSPSAISTKDHGRKDRLSNRYSRRITKFDSLKQRSVYLYDKSGRLVEVDYYGLPEHRPPLKHISFSYDRQGRLSGYNDNTTSARYAYNALGQKIKEEINYGPFTLKNRYSYYPNGLQKSFTGPDGNRYRYHYDVNGRLNQIKLPDEGMVDIRSYCWNRPAIIQLPNGLLKTLKYNSLMQLRQMRLTSSTEELIFNQTYTFDSLGRLTAERPRFAVHDSDNKGFPKPFRINGPIQGKQFLGNDDAHYLFIPAPAFHQLRCSESSMVDSAPENHFVCNQQGNLSERRSRKETFRFFYDISNRLVGVEDSAGKRIATYYYDPFGRRLWKETENGRAYYHYMEEKLAAEYDADGKPVRTYGYLPEDIWNHPNGPLFLRENNQYYWYHNAPHGGPQCITSGNGTLKWKAAYDAFGKAHITYAAIDNPIRAGHQYFDAETGLHYDLKQYYDPGWGKYIGNISMGIDPDEAPALMHPPARRPVHGTCQHEMRKIFEMWLSPEDKYREWGIKPSTVPNIY